MVRWTAAVLLFAAVTLTCPAVASADPLVPQVGTPCEPKLVDAMTWPPEAKAPLSCTAAGWQPVATPYPVSDRWVSYGPPMRLHGDGRRNPVIESGDWNATPLVPDGRCRAEQLPVVPGVGLGPPRIDEGPPGQVLNLQLLPRLFSIDMTGHCLWEKVDG
jgi:hypothetical protein